MRSHMLALAQWLSEHVTTIVLVHAGAHTASAEGFLNRYRNAWPAAVTATRSWVEDAVKRKGRPPPGTSTHIQLSELPIPLPLSRFQWPLVSS